MHINVQNLAPEESKSNYKMPNIQRKTKGTADYVDKYVGKQLRNRRTLLGLSQEKLANSVGITFQQVQKYERGTNRISSSRLYSFSKVLDVSIDYFYDGIENGEKRPSGMSDNEQEAFKSKSSNIPENIFSEKETLALIKIYYSVEDEEKRKDMMRLLKTMAKSLK